MKQRRIKRVYFAVVERTDAGVRATIPAFDGLWVEAPDHDTAYFAARGVLMMYAETGREMPPSTTNEEMRDRWNRTGFLINL